MRFVAVDSKKIKNAFSLALFAAQEQILTDCNYFCREDEGTLKDSAQSNVSGVKMEATWNTPYARRVYYTGTPSKDKNENASLRWAEKAKNRFKKDWQAILQRGLRRNL